MELNEKQRQEFGDILSELGRTLDITRAQYEEAVKKYQAVGNWLGKEDSELHPYEVDILPQGSFRLGTMIRPINDEDELDIDLVCRLKSKPMRWTQFHLKQAVGNRLKANGDYKRMLDEEGRRCWTLNYADKTGFHMDILPAIISHGYRDVLENAMSKASFGLGYPDFDKLAIRMTDNEIFSHYTESNVENWPKSNPFGYSIWFYDRAKVEIMEKRSRMALSAAIEPVPAYQKEKLPLQRAVQILKRHRDMMFEGGDEDKPISIIITTLASRAYNKETNVLDALFRVVFNVESYIEEKWSDEHQRYIKWIANPVNPEENFADKWPDHPKREDNFYQWLEKVKEDVRNLVGQKGIIQVKAALAGPFGERIAEQTLSNYSKNMARKRERGELKMQYGSGLLGSVGTTVDKHTFFGNQDGEE